MTDLPTLVRAAQQGNKDAFGQIVYRFQDMAYASAYALLGDVHLAQDAAQEAFLDAYLNLKKLHDPAAFPGWFRRIIVGNSHRQLRSRPVATLSLDALPPDDAGSLYMNLADPTPGPADVLEALNLRQSIHTAISVLSPNQRQVIVLFYVEGYSQQEIAAFLEVPISTVKKRLFDARHNLKQRMVPMLQAELKAAKPSQNTDFANRVNWFLALRDHDLVQVKKLVAQHPDLLQTKTEWKMALGHHYWPLGSNALHLAASAGSTAILAYLLTQPIDATEKNLAGMTPLHLAAMMKQPETVRLLLQHGVEVNARSTTGQTPLQHAVLRNYAEIVELLLQHGADLALADSENRTALDWALLRQN
ncbi:MAG: sigma-70 family RNA polymerase sigma factor, partial [Chloroflexota bacterium]|nr:sigma-70 family RNA polymerase sigma factor [Chloroflexota bacterium]